MKLRTIITVMAVVAVFAVAGSGYLYYRALKHAAVQRTSKTAEKHGQLVSSRVAAFLESHMRSVAVVAGLSEVRQGVSVPGKPAGPKLNALLDHVRDSLGIEVCYLMDQSGTTVAASNRNSPKSFVGKNYGFRPYFRQAAAGKPAVYMAVGVTSGKKGIYYSHPVYAAAGEKPSGVLVIKESTAGLEKKLRDLELGHPGVAMITGARGVVFLAGKRGWAGKLLWQISKKEVAAITAERQFGKGPWPWSGLSRGKKGAVADRAGRRYLVSSQAVPEFPGWHTAFLVKLDDEIRRAVAPLKNTLSTVSLVMFCLVGIAVLFLHRQAVADIRRKKQIQEALEEREVRLRQLLDAIQAGVMLVSVDGMRITDLNPAAEAMIGASRDQVLGAPCGRFMEVPEQGRCPVLEHGRQMDCASHHLICANGKRLPILKTVKEVTIEGRRHLLETFADVSELLEAKKALEAEHSALLKIQKDLAKAQKLARIGNWEWEIDTGAVSWSEEFSRIFGISETRPSIEALSGLIHPEDRKAWRKKWEEALGNNGDTEFECRGLHADGTAIWIRIEAQVRKARAGKPRRMFGIVQDISERRQWEKKIRQKRDFLNTLMETIPNPMFHKNAEGRYTGCNAAFEVFVGKSREEIVGKTVYDLYPKETADAFHERDRKVLQNTGAQHFKGKMRRSDGILRDVAVAKAAIQNKDGETAGLIGIISDITDLEEARAKAEDASRAKSEFLANMSHEIRTPMNGIIGMTDLVLGTDLTDEQRDFIETIKQSADNLMMVINDVLDFSKIESGKIEMEEIGFDLRSTVEAAAETLAVRADEKGLELICDIGPDIPERLRGDPGKLRQILINLGGNALKFTDEGEVVICCRNEERSQDRLRLHFSVSDTGIGIPADKLDTVFESFRQADGSMTRKYGGTGLGLSISKTYAELMGGRMWAESRVGEGSTFHFTAEFSVCQEKTTKQHPFDDFDLSGRRVLIVDDSETNRRILKEMVTGWGMDQTEAPEGNTAIRKLSGASGAGRPFDLVLLDLQMPEVDGFEVARFLQEEPSPPSIILLTSVGRRGDAARCREYGIDAYLTKPIKKSELHEAVCLVLNEGAAPDAADKEEGPVTRHTLRERRFAGGKQILLAEDDAINRKVAVNLLEKLGHRAVVAENGKDAVARFKSRRFDLILMDVQMPTLDGLAATSEIRQIEKHRGGHIPIVAMTAHAVKGDREKCLDAGMDDYLSKPIRADLLRAKIARWTKAEVPAAEGEAEKSPKEASLAGSADPIDLQKAMAQLMGNDPLLEELLEEFPVQCREQLDHVAAAMKFRDGERLRKEAHRLKGTAANLWAGPIAATSLALEKAGRKGDLDAAAPLVQNLEDQIRRLETFLEERRRLSGGGNGSGGRAS